MFRNYFKIAWRNLLKNKTAAVINIGGLSAGLTVAMLIGLWMYSELSYNHYHPNHKNIALVMESRRTSSGIGVSWNTPYPTGPELRNLYGSDFKHVIMSSLTSHEVLTSGSTPLNKSGYYMEPGAIDMLGIRVIKGSSAALNDPSSILLSASLAAAFFGDRDPIGQLMKINNEVAVKVAGVYKDIPANSDFSDMQFLASWKLYVANREWIQKDNWDQDGFQTYVQIADHAGMEQVSAKIKDLKLRRVSGEEARQHPQMFLFPMDRWRLYSEFDNNGISTGGSIRYVWMFGIIGVFVLLLACINFMNLSTARSEKRAREVGIRKAIGSMRKQLVGQFMSESLLVVAFAFVGSLLVTQLMLPFFNQVAGKMISIPWEQPLFWIAGIGFSMLTACIAGSYPAFYLSAFQPVKALKGTFRAGRLAVVPRKVLVIVQFTVSATLIIGVIVVFRQIQLGKNRSVGYNRNGLIMVSTPTPEIHEHFAAVYEQLKQSGAVTEAAESLNRMTGVSFGANGLDWDNTGPHSDEWFAKAYVTAGFGKTVGWQFAAGRDFSPQLASDSNAIVLNEAAVKYMGLKDPVGKVIKITLFDKTTPYTVIGVIKDMLMESPYRAIRKTVYMLDNHKGNYLNIRLSPHMNTSAALQRIEKVFKSYMPDVPFEYSFVDDEFAKKFESEQQVGSLATLFAVLAVFISCLGLFGLVAFVAEQRTKEIGVRKVLGASVFSIWGLISREFAWLVLIALLLAVPLSWYFMHSWLQNYEYRTTIPWWIFAAAGVGTLFITLLTVSHQSIKAALMNPVKSLRSE
jgi:ABC-type antimicrobial peptide transport system permease subunit